MTAAARERAALVETLREVGPDAPTLCGNWTTRDLAAHLILRERHPVASLGIMIAPLADRTARAQQRLAERTDWEQLVEWVADGPPLYSPFKLIDPLVNTAEMVIHHEDVRRAAPGWEPRAIDGGTLGALRRMLPFAARMSLGRGPARVTIRDADGSVVTVVGKGRDVEIIGGTAELVLFLSGRDAVRLEFRASPDGVDAVRAARRKL